MKRLGLLITVAALSSGCIIVTDGDETGESGDASSSSESEGESGTGSTESGDGDSETAGDGDAGDGDGDSGDGDSGDGDSGDGDSGDGDSGDGDSGDGDGDEEQLCVNTGGTWDPTACMHYVCGVPNDCEAIIPGCDCGTAANFAEGVGCVPDKSCGGALGDGDTCDPVNNLCGTGLACCYPCGIPGCDYQCTPEVDGGCPPPPP